MKFYIDKPYRDKRIFDVMYGESKLGEGFEPDKSISFETVSFINEIAGRVVCTEDTIEEAAAWCREQGYRTWTSLSKYVDPDSK